jgi:putative addiction module CopG family antidote
MAAGTVSIPSKRFDAFAQRLVESGRYNSPSEVLEAAIDALEREECDEEAKELYLNRLWRLVSPVALPTVMS